MNYSARLSILSFFSGLLAVNAQYTDVINSNRPGQSMSAFSVGKTVLQAEMGFSMNKQDHKYTMMETTGYDGDLVFRYGAFLEQLEFIGSMNYSYDDISTPTRDYALRGIEQAHIGAKYLVYDPHKKFVERKPNLYSWKANHKFEWRNLIPAVGVYAGANLRVSKKFPPYDQARLSLKGMLITQNQLGRYVLVTNIMMDRFGSNNETLAYIATLTYGINANWSAFVENQGIQSDIYGDLIFRGGAAYLLAGNMQIDASVGASVKNTPSILTAGVGFSWRFDELYEDVLVRLPGEEKADGKDKKDKKKKKRKDEVPGAEEPQP